MPGTFSVTVGAGCEGSPSGLGSGGGDSYFGPPTPANLKGITCIGGGGGGQGSQNNPPTNVGHPGGSGGGGGSPAGPPSDSEAGGWDYPVNTLVPYPWPGPTTQGSYGGTGQHVHGDWASGGGGGGAGQVGYNAVSPGSPVWYWPGFSGNGGAGLANAIAGEGGYGTLQNRWYPNTTTAGNYFAGGGAGEYFYQRGIGGAGGGGGGAGAGAG